MPKPFARVGGEIVLVSVLLVAWLLTWLSIERSLGALTPVGRAIYLDNASTAGNLVAGLGLGVIVLAAVPLRHRSPVIAFAVAAASAIALQWFFPLLFLSGVVIPLAVAVTIVWFTWKVPQWWWIGVMIVPLLIASGVRSFQLNERSRMTQFEPTSTTLSISDFFQDALFYAIAVVGGLAVRQIIEQRSVLEQRNAELRVERARTAKTAVLDERLRISRELHDVVAHHVTTMTVHAGAARQIIDSSPGDAKESLRQVESSGRDAVGELHQMLGYLRSGEGAEVDGNRLPAPSLRHLDYLQQSFGSKLDCDVAVTGDLTDLPAAVDASAYRIVQEALTNTLKHSTATTAVVVVDVGAEVLTVSVTDSGEPRSGRRPEGGHGIVGMRERASLHGGAVDVGPARCEPGWSVHAVLPFGGMQ